METVKDIAAWTAVIVCCPIWFPIKCFKDAVPRRRQRCGTMAMREGLEQLHAERTQEYKDYLRVNTPKPFNTRRRALSTERRFSLHPSQSQSMFLTRLPAEIRQQIYEYVLGGSTFHIIQVPRRLAHVRCDRDPDAPYCAPSFFVSSSSVDRPDLDLNDATRKCFPLCRNRFSPSSPVYDSSQLTQAEVWRRYGPLILNSLSTSEFALLRVCRQIYREAISLLYSHNIFDFDSALTFVNFCININPNRLSQIRSLQIRSEFHNSRHTADWSYYIAPPFMRENYEHDTWERAWKVIANDMTGLRHLYLMVDTNARDTPRGVNERWLKPILEVKGLRGLEVAVKERGRFLDANKDREMRVLVKMLRKRMCGSGKGGRGGSEMVLREGRVTFEEGTDSSEDDNGIDDEKESDDVVGDNFTENGGQDQSPAVNVSENTSQGDVSSTVLETGGNHAP